MSWYSGFNKELAYEMEPHGIHINAGVPGVSLTEPIVKNYWYSVVPKGKRELINRTPLGRTAEVDEIVTMVVFLNTHDASLITGTCIDGNGGTFMAENP